jgi:hypothetical protein
MNNNEHTRNPDHKAETLAVLVNITEYYKVPEKLYKY